MIQARKGNANLFETVKCSQFSQGFSKNQVIFSFILQIKAIVEELTLLEIYDAKITCSFMFTM
jgi:hypothetical protein